MLPLAALILAGCAGTESPIFESTELTPRIPPASVAPPPGLDAVNPDPAEMLLPPPISKPQDEDAGTQVDLGLDSDASFDWTETLPGRGTCKSGRYVGGFECTTPGLGGLPVSIAGEIAFTLLGSAEEQNLIVDDGSIGGLFFTAADMSGQLDCTRDRFDAFTLDGQAFVLGPGAFAAALSGAFDDQALGIEGVFSMINERGQTCEGTFRVGIAP